jgi:hypothetical protein
MPPRLPVIIMRLSKQLRVTICGIFGRGRYHLDLDCKLSARLAPLSAVTISAVFAELGICCVYGDQQLPTGSYHRGSFGYEFAR